MSAILLAVLLTVATPPFEARTLDGQVLDGPLVALDASHLTIQTSQGPASVDTERLVGITREQTPVVTSEPNGVHVELVGGSQIFGRQYTCRDGRASLALFDGQVLQIPVRDVLSVRFGPDSGPLAADWHRLLGTKRATDLLVVHKDESLDYHKGVLHDVAEDMVHFDVDGDILPVNRAKVYGLAYHHRAEGEWRPVLCRVTDICGSQWSACSLSFSGKKFQWLTPTGVGVSLPVENVVQIDFSSGKIVYLSDLKPESVRWTPFFGMAKLLPVMEQFYLPRQDRNFDSEPLLLGGTQYAKGLAVHSRTEITYRVPSSFSRFHAVVGIDDTVHRKGKVQLVVRGDGNVLAETTVASNDPPKPIDLDLAGVHRLTILVDFADAANPGDHLLLCDARVTK